MNGLEQVSGWIGVLGGLVVVGTFLIGVLVFALRRAKQEQESAEADRVLNLQREELDLLRQRAAQIPEMETQIRVLREEVGAAKAIAEMRANMEGGFAKMAATLDAMDRRGQKADRWQAEFNRKTVAGLNDLLTHFHLSPVGVEPPRDQV